MGENAEIRNAANNGPTVLLRDLPKEKCPAAVGKFYFSTILGINEFIALFYIKN